MLIIAAGTVYPIPYLRQNFENSLLELFGLTQAQLGQCNSLLGVMLFLTYLPSGWLADRIQPNWLLAISMAGTGALALALATAPAFFYIKLIYIALGLTTGLTLWASLIRTTSLIAPHNQQGQFFGLLESGRGVMEALLATLALAFFAYAIEQQTLATTVAVSRVLIFYGVAALGLSPLVFSHCHHPTRWQIRPWPALSRHCIGQTTRRFSAIHQSGCRPLLFWWAIRFLGDIFLCRAAREHLWDRRRYRWHNNRCSPVDAAHQPSYCWRHWRQISIGAFFGLLLLIAAGMLAVIPLLPANASVLVLLVMILCVSLVTFGIRGIYWATLDDCNVRASTRGMAVGIISIVAYTPDIYVPMIQGWCLSLWPGREGYIAYYGIFSATGIIGCLAALKLANLSEQRHGEY